MNFLTSAFFSFSVGIGGFFGLLRFRKIDPVFFPFIFLLWAGFLAEAISLLLSYKGYSSTVNFNCFALAEALLLYFQFERWQFMGAGQRRFWLPALFCCWGLEILLRPAPVFCSYFIIGYSFAFVLISISQINKIIYKDSSPLLKNPVFLICVGFIFYFSFSALTETFWIFGIRQSTSFRLHINELHNYVNLFTNLVYAFAILWMPLKQDFILPY